MKDLIRALVSSKLPVNLKEKLVIRASVNGFITKASLNKCLKALAASDFHKLNWLAKQIELSDEPRAFEKKPGMEGREHYKDYAYKKHYMRFKDEEGQKSAFIEFMKNLVKEAFIHETENPKFGMEHLKKASKNATLAEAKKYASPELEMMIEEMEKLVGEKATLDTLKVVCYPEAAGPTPPENTLFVAHIGEITVDPHGIKGKINGKDVIDLFDALGQGLYEKDVAALAGSLPMGADWDWNGTENITIPAHQDTWVAIVDEEAFEAKLEALRASEEKHSNTAASVTASAKIPAEVHTDDHHHESRFDAEPWFKQATDEEIVELAKIGWRGDYAADLVAEWTADRNKEVRNVLKNTSPRDGVGFECSVDEDAAVAWLKKNKKELWTKIEQN